MKSILKTLAMGAIMATVVLVAGCASGPQIREARPLKKDGDAITIHRTTVLFMDANGVMKTNSLMESYEKMTEAAAEFYQNKGYMQAQEAAATARTTTTDPGEPIFGRDPIGTRYNTQPAGPSGAHNFQFHTGGGRY